MSTSVPPRLVLWLHVYALTLIFLTLVGIMFLIWQGFLLRDDLLHEQASRLDAQRLVTQQAEIDAQVQAGLAAIKELLAHGNGP